MTIVDASKYDPSKGFYASVKPCNSFQPFTIDHEGWEANDPSTFHATLSYDKGAAVSLDDVNAFFDRIGVANCSSFQAYSVTRPVIWAYGGKAYFGIEFYSVELFNLQCRMAINLGLKSDHDQYKCHLTFGKIRGLSDEQLNDTAFLTSLLPKRYAVPGLVNFSNLTVENIEG